MTFRNKQLLIDIVQNPRALCRRILLPPRLYGDFIWCSIKLRFRNMVKSDIAHAPSGGDILGRTTVIYDMVNMSAEHVKEIQEGIDRSH
jgi:hypothetical protein